MHYCVCLHLFEFFYAACEKQDAKSSSKIFCEFSVQILYTAAVSRYLPAILASGDMGTVYAAFL